MNNNMNCSTDLPVEDPLQRRYRVLLMAYMISPVRGSEYSVAWNFVTQMSKHCDITVLYGAAGDHMGDFGDMEDFLSSDAVPHVEFLPVTPGGFARFLNSANQRGILSYTFYVAYRLWHRRAFQVAQKVMKNQKFDLIHYLGPIGYREPGYMWRLPLPYVWGPIGGATHVPLSLVSALPWAGKLKLIFRAAANWMQLRFSARVRRALARSDVLLVATTENQEIFRNVLGREGEYLPENGIVGPVSLNLEKFKVLDKIRLVWIGNIEARKALVLLVRALGRCRFADRFCVDVVGDGPLRSDLQSQVKDVGLASVFCWHGQVSRQQVRDILDQAHLHVVTSVSEGNPTTIWEAMSCGVPTLSLDHCGMHDTVLPDSGIKIAVTDLDKIVEDIASALDRLAQEPDHLRSMAHQVVAHAADFHWDKRPEFFMSVYRRAMTKHHAG